MELQHLRHFTLPKPTTFPDTRRYGYPSGPIALHPDRDKLYVGSHIVWGQVGLVQIPLDGDKLGHVIEPLPIEGDEAHAARLTQGIDNLGGFAVHGTRLHYCFNVYYAVRPPDEIDYSTFGSCSLSLDDPTPGLRRVGPRVWPFHQKSYSGYMCTHNGWVYCGRGDGAGSVASPRGPALFRFDPADPAKAEVVYYRGHDEQGRTDVPDWDPSDKWRGLAFIDDVPVFTGFKGGGRSWYGGPEVTWEDGTTSHDPHFESKGYHSETYTPILQVGLDRNPSDFVPLPGFRPASRPLGCAFDDDDRLLYVLEDGREVGSENEPRIHVYGVPSLTPDPVPEPAPTEETIIVSTSTTDTVFRGPSPTPQIDAAAFLLGRAKEFLEDG